MYARGWWIYRWQLRYRLKAVVEFFFNYSYIYKYSNSFKKFSHEMESYEFIHSESRHRF